MINQDDTQRLTDFERAMASAILIYAEGCLRGVDQAARVVAVLSLAYEMATPDLSPRNRARIFFDEE